MTIETEKYLMLAGNVRASELDTNGTVKGYKEVGNARVKVKRNSEKKELNSVMTANFGEAVASVQLNRPAEFTMEFEGMTSSTISWLFGGDVIDSSVVGASVAGESHVVKELDAAIRLDYPDVSSVVVWTGSEVSATTTASTSKIGANAHGLNNGDVVRFTEIVTTTGIVINTNYYVVNKTTNDFQVSATVGGAALTLTGDGTAKYIHVIDPTKWAVDNAKLGLVNILTGAAAVDDTVKVSYTYATTTKRTIRAGTKSQINLTILADLQNLEDGAQYTLEIPKVNVMSDSEISFIGEEFVMATLTGTPISVNSAPPYTLVQYD